MKIKTIAILGAALVGTNALSQVQAEDGRVFGDGTLPEFLTAYDLDGD